MRPPDDLPGRRLPLVHQPQQTFFYCGPAASSMVLATLLPEPPTQLVLAGAEDLQTDLYQETPSRYRICEVINRYLGEEVYRVQDLSRPSTAMERHRFAEDVLRSIREGKPLVCSLKVEPSSPRPHYGYPQDRLIEHFVVVHGYGDAGEVVLVADPAGQSPVVAWGHAVPAEYEAPTDAMTAVIKGYLTVPSGGLPAQVQRA